MNLKKSVVIVLFFMMVLVIPILFHSQPVPPLCNIVSAQNDPCLEQKATISALELEHLQLQLTNEALSLDLQAARSVEPAERLVTFVVVITATPSSTTEPTVEKPTAEHTPDADNQLTPTVTLAPTAVNAQLEIVEIIGAGDITREGVIIRNNGALVDISGWTLSDGEGNTYAFPEGRRLFSGAGVTVNTRAGEDTAILFFWGRDEPVFGEPGDVAVLKDQDGRVQASMRVSDS